jgi:hypothetical protein
MVGAVGEPAGLRNAWLDQLQTRSPHYREFPGSTTIDGEHFESRDGVIEHLCVASAELCVTLESEAPFGEHQAAMLHETAAAPDISEAQSDTEAQRNKARVDEFIREMRRQPGQNRFSRRDFWTEAGYTNATEFQRWQRNDWRTTHTARNRFEKLLTKGPHAQRSQ